MKATMEKKKKKENHNDFITKVSFAVSQNKAFQGKIKKEEGNILKRINKQHQLKQKISYSLHSRIFNPE